LTVMLEDPQNVEVRHADPGLDHATGTGAAMAADHLVQLLDDRVDQGVGRGARGWRRGARGSLGAVDRGVDSSHCVNNLATMDDRVKHDDSTNGEQSVTRR